MSADDVAKLVQVALAATTELITHVRNDSEMARKRLDDELVRLRDYHAHSEQAFDQRLSDVERTSLKLHDAFEALSDGLTAIESAKSEVARLTRVISQLEARDVGRQQGRNESKSVSVLTGAAAQISGGRNVIDHSSTTTFSSRSEVNRTEIIRRCTLLILILSALAVAALVADNFLPVDDSFDRIAPSAE